jgi:CubicO group peptidase (beta-lactamase class C family)
MITWFDTTRIANLDARKRRITLRDILTMSPGLEWNESLPYTDSANSAIQMEASSDWVAFVINRPMAYEPGTHWAYSSGASVLMGAILEKATGQSVPDYARAHLFEPLGITDWYWKGTPAGPTDTEGGLYLRTTDLAKLAWLYLEGGDWQGKQLVPREWVTLSLSPVAPVATDARFRYGFQWWLYADPVDTGRWLPSGSGYGGQFPMLFPGDSMVVVINQWNIHGPPSMSPRELARRVEAARLAPTAPSAPLRAPPPAP